jgi:hypothetical protein
MKLAFDQDREDCDWIGLPQRIVEDHPEVFEKVEGEDIEEREDSMAKKKIKSIEELVDLHYEEMFYWLTDSVGDEWSDLSIEIRIASDGKTIKRSWADRNEWLKKEEER